MFSLAVRELDKTAWGRVMPGDRPPSTAYRDLVHERSIRKTSFNGWPSVLECMCPPTISSGARKVSVSTPSVTRYSRPLVKQRRLSVEAVDPLLVFSQKKYALSKSWTLTQLCGRYAMEKESRTCTKDSTSSSGWTGYSGWFMAESERNSQVPWEREARSDRYINKKLGLRGEIDIPCDEVDTGTQGRRAELCALQAPSRSIFPETLYLRFRGPQYGP